MSKVSNQNQSDAFSSGFEGSGSDTEDGSELKSSKNNGILQNLFANRNYQELTKQTKFKVPQIDSDEEIVHILKIPKGIDPMCLKNKKFSLTKKTKVRTQSDIYYIKPLSDVAESRFFIGSDGLKKINPASILHLEKYVENENEKEEIVEEDMKRAHPIDVIKERHPIFGEKYEARIKLNDEIRQKLLQAFQRFEEKKETPKKKKKQTVDNEDYDDKSLLISQILEAKFKSKKSKKSEKKETESLDTISSIQQSDTNNAVHKESKKSKKKNKTCDDVHCENDSSVIYDDTNIKKEVQSESDNPKKKKKRTESLDAILCIQQSDTNNAVHKESKSKKKNKTLDEVHCGNDSSVICDDDISIKIKKEVQSESDSPKKKRKRSGASDSFFSNLQQEFDFSFAPPAKKRKPSILSSTILKESSPDFKPDLSVIFPEK